MITEPYKCRACTAAFVGNSREELERIIEKAKLALAKLPVEVTPTELARLQGRDQLLTALEAEVRPALAPHRDLTQAGWILLDWLKRTDVLRGQRL